MSEFRNRVLVPASIPIVAVAVIGILTFAFSRVLLAVPEMGSTTLAFLLSGMILFAASVIAATGARLKKSQKIISLLAGVSVLVAGAGSAALGIREIELHGTEVEVAAEDIAYEQKELTFPAGVEVSLVFENRDAGTDHDVDIFADDSFQPPPIFDGATFPGVATVTYEVPALDPGTYAFRCSIHPQMTGTITASEDAGGHGEEPAGEGGGDGHGAPSSADATVSAEGIAFLEDEVTLEADHAASLEFQNLDANIPHNVAIWEDDSFSEALFEGEIFNGIETRTYSIPALDAGSYPFRCEVHPNMLGTVVVE